MAKLGLKKRSDARDGALGFLRQALHRNAHPVARLLRAARARVARLSLCTKERRRHRDCVHAPFDLRVRGELLRHLHRLRLSLSLLPRPRDHGGPLPPLARLALGVVGSTQLVTTASRVPCIQVRFGESTLTLPFGTGRTPARNPDSARARSSCFGRAQGTDFSPGRMVLRRKWRNPQPLLHLPREAGLA